MKALICGGRDFCGVEYAVERIERVHAETPISTVISGHARGGDSIGEFWADAKGIPVEGYPADWNRYGKKAGPLRNEQMLRDGHPDAVIGLPGGTGTAHMVRISREAGVRVIAYQARPFRKENPDLWYLSNFAQHEIIDEDGCVWPSSEHFYQAEKTLVEIERSRIQAAPTPAEAKRLGRHVNIRHDWDSIKIDVMDRILQLKFPPGGILSERLLATGEDYLVEDSTPWKDYFWGAVAGKGQNWLGQLLCRQRSRLRLDTR